MTRKTTDRRRSTTTGAPRAWQRMLSGRRLDLLDPSPLDIEIDDIAHGLARVARWNGQTRGEHAFSVAQHSVLVEAFFSAIWSKATPADKLGALLHDAPEYVIGDMISPFKAVIGESYKSVEARILAAIHMRFALPATQPAALLRIVKQADGVSAFIEATRIAGFNVTEAEQFFGRPKVAMRNIEPLMAPMDSAHAETLFLMRFRELEDEMNANGN